MTIQARGADEANTSAQMEQYGWTLRDNPGEFAWIPKEQLHIDYSYQRKLVQERVLALARVWSWVACGVLIVVLRPSDGIWVVLDGQHRLAAAQRRGDIKDLPCMVFEVEDGISDEAQGFLAANTNRRPLHTVEKFKALRIVGDPLALVVEELATSIGRSVSASASSSSVSCVRTIMSCVASDEAAIRRLWPLIGTLCQGAIISHEIVKALFYLETRLPEGVSLLQPHWRSRITQVRLPGLEDAMRQAAGFRGNRGPKTLAEGVANLLNHRARKRLPWPLDGAEDND